MWPHSFVKNRFPFSLRQIPEIFFFELIDLLGCVVNNIYIVIYD